MSDLIYSAASYAYPWVENGSLRYAIPDNKAYLGNAANSGGISPKSS